MPCNHRLDAVPMFSRCFSPDCRWCVIPPEMPARSASFPGIFRVFSCPSAGFLDISAMVSQHVSRKEEEGLKQFP